MAIKERKQITGTTAQINAYEGHEGQIVWDKDKKTFVGMSGTAGKNYPLASQAYVDTQFLPLTGGEIRGVISYRAQNGEFSISSSTKGARLALNDATREDYSGQVILQADDGTNRSFFTVFPNGDPTFNGCVVDSIVQQSNEVVRYASGLQIVWTDIPITTTKGELKVWNLTYPAPFFGGRPMSVSIALKGGWGYSTTNNLEDVFVTGCGGTVRRLEGDPVNNAYLYCIAIGYWR